MIFQQTIEKNTPSVREAVAELFDVAFKNQTHPQDLLLIIEHGFYDKKNEEPLNGKKFSPFVIGPALIGHAKRTDYAFFHWYRESHLGNEEEFDKNISNPEVREFEETTIHFEKMIYLKFWESDMILKELLQLANLALGKNYDWFINIPTYERDRSKQSVIREEIRDKLISACPKFYELIKRNYKTQLRNAIAHSQYGFLSRTIQYLNYSENPAAHSNIAYLSFEDWGDYFHDMLLIYNEIISGFNKYRDNYYEKTLQNNNSIEIRIIKQDNSTQLKQLGIRKGFKAWAWRENLDASDFS